jgi:hypothetical protein
MQIKLPDLFVLGEYDIEKRNAAGPLSLIGRGDQPFRIFRIDF